MQNGVSGISETAGEGAPAFPQFSATLLPHRSLSRKGFVALMLTTGSLSLGAGAAFAVRGAWPVAGFSGLAVALLYLAFRLNYRAALLRERVVLAERELRITRLHPSGARESWSFNPYWVRFQHLRRDTQADELSLSMHGRKLVFGAFLSDSEKLSFAAAFSTALAHHSAMHFRGM
jgi:uncharacterized membrane protein